MDGCLRQLLCQLDTEPEIALLEGETPGGHPGSGERAYIDHRVAEKWGRSLTSKFNSEAEKYSAPIHNLSWTSLKIQL